MKTSTMFRKVFLIQALAVVMSFSGAWCGFCVTQAPASTESGQAPVQFSSGSAEVLKLTEARVDPEVIKAYIKTLTAVAKPSAAEIIALKDRGVPEDVITVLLQKAAQPSAEQVAPQPVNPSITVPPVEGQEAYPPEYDTNAQPGYVSYPYSYPAAYYPSYGYSYWYDPIWPYFWPTFYWGCYPYHHNCVNNHYAHNYPYYSHGYYAYHGPGRYFPYQHYANARPYAYPRYGNQMGNWHANPSPYRYANGRYGAMAATRAGVPPGFVGRPGMVSGQHLGPAVGRAPSGSAGFSGRSAGMAGGGRAMGGGGGGGGRR